MISCTVAMPALYTHPYNSVNTHVFNSLMHSCAMSVRETIKELVRKRAEQTGESLTAQAKAMGMTQATLYRIVSGEIKNPSHEKLKAIARFYRCTIDDLESGAALGSTEQADSRVERNSAMRLLEAAQKLHPEWVGVLSPWADLATFLNESDQTINNWRSRGVPRTRAHELCGRIGCRWQWVLNEEGTMVPDKSVTYVADAAPATNRPARAPEPKYIAAEITYDKIKAAVSGVLQAFGLRYEDLVQDDAARRRIEAALKPREHLELGHAEDEEILSHGSYGRFAPEMPEARPVLGIQENHYPAEVDPYADLNARDEPRPKRKERRG